MTTHLDGNVLAGTLAEIFAVDTTAARVSCVHCDRSGALAELEVYVGGPGMTGRCPGCQEVVLRLAQTSDHVYLDLRGTTALRISPSP
jgi:hypothetical protein